MNSPNTNPRVNMKVLIGPSSFAEQDDAPLALLREAGLEIIPNPWKRRYTKAETITLLQGVRGLIAGLEPLDAEVLRQAHELKVISRCGVGMSNVDQAEAVRLGIAVFNTPDGPTDSVAELTVGAMLAGLRHLPQVNASLHAGNWDKRIGRLLGSQTVAVVGCGRIGRRVIALLRGFGCRMIGVDPHVTTAPEGVEMMTLAEALPLADVITLHLAGEECILNREAFAHVKHGVFICNAARGGNVDEVALVDALQSGKVARAWLDALSAEPYKGPLQAFDQVILTPHVASYTAEGRKRMELDCARNLLRGLGKI
ncbi:MAG: phosphoglycerate dehydrogenase [Lentisphaerota bacterium]